MKKTIAITAALLLIPRPSPLRASTATAAWRRNRSPR